MNAAPRSFERGAIFMIEVCIESTSPGDHEASATHARDSTSPARRKSPLMTGIGAPQPGLLISVPRDKWLVVPHRATFAAVLGVVVGVVGSPISVRTRMLGVSDVPGTAAGASADPSGPVRPPQRAEGSVQCVNPVR